MHEERELGVVDYLCSTVLRSHERRPDVCVTLAYCVVTTLLDLPSGGAPLATSLNPSHTFPTTSDPLPQPHPFQPLPQLYSRQVTISEQTWMKEKHDTRIQIPVNSWRSTVVLIRQMNPLQTSEDEWTEADQFSLPIKVDWQDLFLPLPEAVF